VTQAERRWRHWLTDATTIQRYSFLCLTNSLCFSSVRCHYYVSGFVENATAVLCPEWTRDYKYSKFYKILSVLTKIMLNIFLALFFLWRECIGLLIEYHHLSNVSFPMTLNNSSRSRYSSTSSKSKLVQHDSISYTYNGILIGSYSCTFHGVNLNDLRWQTDGKVISIANRIA